jgi:hypothetical protein
LEWNFIKIHHTHSRRITQPDRNEGNCIASLAY